MLKYAQFIHDVKRGKILPVYLLYGEEEFLIQEALDLIIRTIVEPGMRDFNFNTVYCRDTPASELVNLCQTIPFMSERRLVIAKEIDAFKAGSLEELVPYLKSPSPSTSLVMVSNQRRYDKKTVLSAVEKSGAVIVFYPLFENEISTWITGWAGKRGLSISPDAANLVMQIVGNDLQKINNELQKIEIYIQNKKEVTRGDIRAVVGDFREYTSFDLVEAIGRKQKDRALLILSKMFQEGEQPVGLLALTAWNFRRLMKAKGMEAEGMAYADIKRKIGIYQFQSASFQEQLRRFTLRELRNVFDIMLTVDRALKSSSLNSKLIMDRMVLELCGTH